MNSTHPVSNPTDYRVERDVVFLPTDRTEKADLYFPIEMSLGKLVPAVVIIHGGGFRLGVRDATREVNIGGNLARNGYIAMSIDYALAEEGKPTWPHNLQDCKTAVRWLRANAERLHIDPEHIGVIGSSAGGTLAALVVLTRISDGFDPTEPYGVLPCSVQCGVDLYGVTDIGSWRDTVMLGKTFAEAPELYRQASPITYAHMDAPPMLILHGTADAVVDVKQSELLAALLKKAGAVHKLVIIPDAPHAFDLVPIQRDLRPLVIGFFDQYLKPER